MPFDPLDPKLNRAPARTRSVHLIGACGTGMGALAGMLKQAGFMVTGSDAQVYPPMSEFLARLGIPVAQGFKPENLAARPDLVIVGNVVRRDNPEAVECARLGLHYLSLPQALGRFFLAGRTPLVAAGTHGKTTSSALAAYILESAGLDPGFFIGGLTQNFAANYRLGQGAYFVLEGDEYDTAFFDKVPKFTHYAPMVGILTSVEFDHADIYPDLGAIERAFARFVELIPAQGLLAAWGDDPRVRAIAAGCKAPVIFYGFDPACELHLSGLAAHPGRTGFTINWRGEEITASAPLIGAHNMLNLAGVLAALTHAGLAPRRAIELAQGFRGVKRRQEVRAQVGGVLVMDDFAHHPTAVAQTLAAVRRAYPGRRLIAVFEPRTNTSRRNVFQAAYASSFGPADLVLVAHPHGAESIPPGQRFDSSRLAREIESQGSAAIDFPTAGDILSFLKAEARPGDLVLVMSNGGFENIIPRLLDLLARRKK